MRKPPDELDRGPAWLRNWLNTLRRFSVESMPLAGANTTMSEQPTGTIINARTGGGGAEPCELEASLVRVNKFYKVSFAWGRIAGRQPDGFSAGGLNPPQYNASAGTYYHAAAHYDWSALQWDSAWIETSSDPDKPNTADTAYALLASVGEENGALSLSHVCGPIWFDPCDLDFAP